jgi:acylpyruvate hydrolase
VMRFANCQQNGDRFVGLVEGDTVHPLKDVPLLSAGLDLTELKRAERLASLPLADVALMAPVLAPGKVICLGLNYRGHVEESRRELPTYPVLFTKFAEAIIGPGDAIVAPPESQQIDYEAELAVVIGRRVRRLRASDATEVIAGYSVANDITMRDYQYKTHQWLQGKAWPRSTPLGPWLVTGDEIDHARSLEIRLKRNGEELQHANTNRMIFDVPTALAAVSEFATLEPGDVILMGTPEGVGFRRDPQVFLRPGDRVRVEIDGIGAIENQVVEEDVSG